MISLPVCRWRELESQGNYLCRSAKFCDPPNSVSASFCAKCSFADHDPPAPLPPTLPCVHLGQVIATGVRDRSKSLDSSQGRFACALHDHCVIAGIDQRLPADVRSCANCSDYVARDPFGANSTQMRRKADDFLAAIPAYPAERYQGRGVVIAGGGDRFFPSLYVTIRALRHFGCRLPIQVWYLGRYREMPPRKQSLLAPFGVECIDADKVRQRHPARHLDGWELKVFATLNSPFQEVLFLDADCYPCRNPEFLFELEEYRSRGAIFWPDLAPIDARLVWAAFGVRDPRRLGSVESGQFLIDKRSCWRPLNLAWFYNDWSDYYYRYCYGDKHTFEVAWARCNQPFVMWESKSTWVDVAFVHIGPDRLPLFVHRCCDKFRFSNHAYNTKQHHPLPTFYSSLPLEHECWQWMTDLARLNGQQLLDQESTIRISGSQRRRPKQARFAVATLYTPEIAEIGERTSKIMTAYAKRHGYAAVIATKRIDASRSPAWSKLLLIERYLDENRDCDWLLWIDADALIANLEHRLEDLVDENVDFLVAADSSPSPINTGVFLVRNCPAALHMIRQAYAKRHYCHHPKREQPAIADAIRDCSETLRTRVVGRRLFNCFADEFRMGDFVVHFAGCSPAAKLAGIKKVMAALAESCGHPFPAPAVSESAKVDGANRSAIGAKR
jgi:hypothetical protein